MIVTPTKQRMEAYGQYSAMPVLIGVWTFPRRPDERRQCEQLDSCRVCQRSRAFNPFPFAWGMHCFPKIASPLRIEPEIRAVAEHAGENESCRGRHAATVFAKLIDLFALHTHGVTENPAAPFVDADRMEPAPPYRKQLPYARRARQQPALTTHTQTHIRVFLVPVACGGLRFVINMA